MEQILNSEDEIKDMKNVIDVSFRIAQAVEISQSTGINSNLSEQWNTLLNEVENAQSMDEILTIVSEFDRSINELREKRNPLSILQFEYESMKKKAEIQGDDESLFTINNALKILDTAQKMEDGNPKVSRIDRIEVLLTWVSQHVPIL